MRSSGDCSKWMSVTRTHGIDSTDCLTTPAMRIIRAFVMM
jgi:hypothetical protein